jgi:hypothetical protein
MPGFVGTVAVYPGWYAAITGCKVIVASGAGAMATVLRPVIAVPRPFVTTHWRVSDTP